MRSLFTCTDGPAGMLWLARRCWIESALPFDRPETNSSRTCCTKANQRNNMSAYTDADLLLQLTVWCRQVSHDVVCIQPRTSLHGREASIWDPLETMAQHLGD